MNFRSESSDLLDYGLADLLGYKKVDLLGAVSPALLSTMRRSAAPSQLGSTAKRPRFTPPTLGNRPTTLNDRPPPSLNNHPLTPRNHTDNVPRTPVLHSVTLDRDQESTAISQSSLTGETTENEVVITKHRNTEDILKLIMQCKSVM